MCLLNINIILMGLTQQLLCNALKAVIHLSRVGKKYKLFFIIKPINVHYNI